MRYLLTCLIPLFCWGDICLFTPPEGWRPLKGKDLSHAEIGFTKKGGAVFNPSIHLTTEVVDCDLKDYLKAVKQIHLAQPNTRWNDLGAIEMGAGTGRLTEIRRPSPCGELALFQAILIKNGTAYILTAATLRQELVSNQKEILTAFRSLTLAPDVWAPIQDPALKEELASAEDWKEFQTLVEKKTDHLGAYWQYLVLKEALQEKSRRTNGR